MKLHVELFFSVTPNAVGQLSHHPTKAVHDEQSIRKNVTEELMQN